MNNIIKDKDDCKDQENMMKNRIELIQKNIYQNLVVKKILFYLELK